MHNIYSDYDEERRKQREPVDHGCEKAESEVSDLLEVAKELLMSPLMPVTNFPQTHLSKILKIIYTIIIKAHSYIVFFVAKYLLKSFVVFLKL